MKIFLGTRLFVIVSTMLVCLLAFGVFSYAAGTFNKPVAATASISASNPDLGVYSNAACTIPVTEVNFANVTSGEPATITIWVKNTGNKAFTGAVVSSDLDSAIGAVTASVVPALAKNGVSQVTLTLTTPVLSENVSPNFTINVDCNY